MPPLRPTGRSPQQRLPRYDPLRYAQRWIVERTTAWLQNFRRALVRHERLLTTYRALVVLACVMITLVALWK
jgi:transposase